MTEPDSTASENITRIIGQLIERDVIRLTPARVPVMSFRVAHSSRQLESECWREVECEIGAVAVGKLAYQIETLATGTTLLIEGFLAAKSVRHKSPVLHVQNIELLKGINHGFQTE